MAERRVTEKLGNFRSSKSSQLLGSQRLYRLYETIDYYADNIVYSLKILYHHGVLPDKCIAYQDSQRKG